MEFERAIRGRITKANTESAKKKYTQYNPVYERWDLVQPDNHLYGKLAAAFTGLVFMVRGGHNSYCENLSLSYLYHSLHSLPPLQVLVVVAIVFSILLYRIAISAVLYVPLVNTAGRAAGAGASIFASITGACVQLVGILIMNFVSVSTHCSGTAACGDVWGIVTVIVGGDTCCSGSDSCYLHLSAFCCVHRFTNYWLRN